MTVTTERKTETNQRSVPNPEGDDGPISEAVVEAVAAVEGVEPSNLTSRLYDSTDPEALDALYRTTTDRGERVTVTFTFAGYEVVVESDRTIRVRETDASSA